MLLTPITTAIGLAGGIVVGTAKMMYQPLEYIRESIQQKKLAARNDYYDSSIGLHQWSCCNSDGSWAAGCTICPVSTIYTRVVEDGESLSDILGSYNFEEDLEIFDCVDLIDHVKDNSFDTSEESEESGYEYDSEEDLVLLNSRS
eukprot:TRINITY_DN4349_c0_g1_i2.p1 TRINITY_DN4349_c0_g1~~TRINITY_DN4349_c0_g1_i2.p1  ORF type:complete len:145 (-),score=34.29 TRINITY_DN4349_c0_g1_i2:24-458(-)